jgi:predicted DNA-binding transcriptional regulator AlpA
MISPVFWYEIAIIEWKNKHLPPSQQIQTPAHPRFLRLKDVENTVGLKRSTIYRQITAGTFPKPLPLLSTDPGNQRIPEAVSV